MHLSPGSRICFTYNRDSTIAMDFKPPLPGSASGGLLRKQALMGAHRSTASHHVSTVLEEHGDGSDHAPEDPGASHASASGSSGRHRVQLRQWGDYWDSCQRVEVAGR